MGDNMEFLIKGTDSNGWLTGAKDGSSLDISPIMGKGFPVKDEFEGYKYDFPVQNLILLCTGTGIAPIRSVIESSILEVETTGPFGRSCTLYYGCRSPSTMAYKDLLLEWEERGITVVPVMSRPGKETWNGRTGYVQQALKEDGVRIPRNTGALLVGQKEMAEESKAILASAGVFEGRILTNF
jgi:NAD(P)H-flavin reductase